MKKLFVVFISLMLVMSLTGCTSDELNEYKLKKIDELDTYINIKTEEQYSQISIENINLIHDNGKKLINNSQSANEVDNTFVQTILELERIKSLNKIQKIKKIYAYW